MTDEFLDDSWDSVPVERVTAGAKTDYQLVREQGEGWVPALARLVEGVRDAVGDMRYRSLEHGQEAKIVVEGRDRDIVLLDTRKQALTHKHRISFARLAALAPLLAGGVRGYERPYTCERYQDTRSFSGVGVTCLEVPLADNPCSRCLHLADLRLGVLALLEEEPRP